MTVSYYVQGSSSPFFPLCLLFVPLSWSLGCKVRLNFPSFKKFPCTKMRVHRTMSALCVSFPWLISLVWRDKTTTISGSVLYYFSNPGHSHLGGIQPTLITIVTSGHIIMYKANPDIIWCNICGCAVRRSPKGSYCVLAYNRNVCFIEVLWNYGKISVNNFTGKKSTMLGEQTSVLLMLETWAFMKPLDVALKILLLTAISLKLPTILWVPREGLISWKLPISISFSDDIAN